jgi:DNA-binding IclR family transcriptional regulator
LLGTLPRAQAPSLLPPEPFPAFTPRTKTTWADVNAAITEGRRNGMHAEEGEIDSSLSCCAIPLLDGDRDEKLALAVSFESRRPDSERRAIQQALRREWRQLAWQI